MTPIKLKVELENMPHKVIRKLLVPEDIDMHTLHIVIQVSMGWQNAHLFEFSDKKWNGQFRVGISDGMEDEIGFQNAYDASLKNTFIDQNNRKPFWYTYDFGDGWLHKISFQKVGKKQLEDFKGQSFCTEAIGKCPPEDIGGPWGYADFLEIIKNKKHPEREEMMEWQGLEPDEKYDETETNIKQINQTLSKIYK